MAKKFKFTDLAYDEIKPISENKENKEIFIDNNQKISENFHIEKENKSELKNSILDTKSEKKKNINYEIDYSEYNDFSSASINQDISQVDKTRTQLRMYSSVLKNEDFDKSNKYDNFGDMPQNLSSTMVSTFSPNKIKDLISFKEKLDVKTNIYLKSSIVIKLKELERRTNESRSSIINKLLEYAIKSMEEN